MEFWTAWYSGNHNERFAFWNRAFGPYAWSFWVMIWCNVCAPQFFWSKRLRRNVWIVFVLALFANIGMWFERFEIIITSLTRDFLPTNWWRYKPTLIDFTTLIGSFGLFFTLFMLFCRYLPTVAMAEVKSIMPQAHPHHEHPEEQTADEKRTDYRPDEKTHHGASHS